MNTSQALPLSNFPSRLARKARGNPAALFTVLVAAAWLGFELFNYSTTEFALRDLIGDWATFGMRWSTLLALAFCGMDFAGVARLFNSTRAEASSRGGWYLFAAWLLAATINASLTWWGVTVAIYNHPVQGALMIDPLLLVRVAPAVVALLVWVMRILLIGALTGTFRPTEDKPEKTSAFGFTAAARRVPPGYQPIPAASQSIHPTARLPRS